jgi:carbonic anhydrase/acetyltransferase-like protein (isoleucine patch superfamily)
VIKQLERFLARKPRLGSGVYIARGAVVVGDVEIGDRSSVWYHAVLRGDINRIVVGHDSNIQDNAVLHLADDFPCLVGSWVTIGHGAIVHACTIEDACLIGMGSIILDGAVVKKNGFVGAGAVVSPGKTVGPGELWLGNPARFVRLLDAKEIEQLTYSAEHYVRLKDRYL